MSVSLERDVPSRLWVINGWQGDDPELEPVGYLSARGEEKFTQAEGSMGSVYRIALTDKAVKTLLSCTAHYYKDIARQALER
jgi:hypothetical protein